jgi:hypothetical protein
MAKAKKKTVKKAAKTAKALKKASGRMCGGCGKRNTGHNVRTCPNPGGGR